MRFDEKGREVPDATPIEVPAGLKKPESLTEMMQRMIRNDLSKFAEEHGAETFEEANDFDCDDEDWEASATHHELHEEVVEEVKRVKREEAEAAARARADGRGAAGEAESEGAADGVPKTAAGSAHRARVPRSGASGKVKARSPQHRPKVDDEDAQSDVDDRSGRRVGGEVDED